MSKANLGFTTFVDVQPDEVITNEDLHRKFSQPAPEVIERITGIRSRRVLSKSVSPYQLAEQTLANLFSRLKISGNDCEMLLVSHTSPNRQAARFLAESLADHFCIPQRETDGESNLVGLCEGCVGVAKAVELLQEKKLTPGKHAVILAVETPSQYTDARSQFGLLFGDRGAATTLTPGGSFPLLSARVVYQQIKLPEEESRYLPCFQDVVMPEAVDFYGRTHENFATVEMDGRRVARFGTRLLKQMTMQTCRELRPTDHELLVVPHQANGRMVGMLKKFLEQGDSLPRICEIVQDLADKGNTESASILSALSGLISSDLFGQQPRVVVCPSVGVCYTDEERLSVGEFSFATGS